MTLYDQLTAILNKERCNFDEAKRQFDRARFQYIKRLNDLKKVIEEVDNPTIIKLTISPDQELTYLHDLHSEALELTVGLEHGTAEAESLEQAIAQTVVRRIEMLHMAAQAATETAADKGAT